MTEYSRGNEGKAKSLETSVRSIREHFTNLVGRGFIFSSDIKVEIDALMNTPISQLRESDITLLEQKLATEYTKHCWGNALNRGDFLGIQSSVRSLKLKLAQ
jgi:hypothetical protein